MHTRTTRPAIDDQQQWLCFRAGDEQAFEGLFNRYCDVLLRYGLTIVPDRDFVKDCIQDLFADLWRRRASLSEAQSVRYYLLVSLRRLLIRQKTAVRRQHDLRRQWQVEMETAVPYSPERAVTDTEQTDHSRNLLMRELNALPARQREAVFLRFYEELDYEQITEIMDLNYQVVRNMVHRAVKTLRQRLEHAKDVLMPVAFALALLALLFRLL
jgi:RNA polymerase sigma factor (sigma-70 family)